jgi:ubiquinone/menaquinone biosynthesis C-methylase UbiE
MNRLNTFNWIAPVYDKLVSLVFGDTLHDAQMHFVSDIGKTDNVLILGGGSGKFLNALLEIKPLTNVTYVEASSRMIALAKKTVGNKANVNFIHGTHNDIPNKMFDVVITNFFFDLFSERQVEGLIRKVSQNLSNNGKWLVTDFEKSPKWSHRLLLTVMYLFFYCTRSVDVMRLPAWQSIFRNEAFTLEKEKLFMDGFVRADVFVKC